MVVVHSSVHAVVNTQIEKLLVKILDDKEDVKKYQ